MSRLAWWREQDWRVTPPYSLEGDDDALQQALRNRIENPKRPRSESTRGFSEGLLLRTAKEIVYYREGEVPALNFVTWSLDLGTAELKLYPSWSTVDFDRNELKRVIAFAMIFDVPVVPDDESLRPELEAVERELMADGFVRQDDGGEGHRYVSRPFATVDVDSEEALATVHDLLRPSPTEVRLALAAARRELDARATAGRLLAALRLGIQELGDALSASSANEADLQACLTRHPHVFGPEYSEIKPQYGLGGDYVLDYALLRPSGLVDLVEIEASTHPLYPSKRNPSAALVHAEQQVLDWLQWIEDFAPLARRDLPQLQRPVGYVVIGRSRDATDETLRRLAQRNQAWGGALMILTYDDLLVRAQTLLSQLEGLGKAHESQRG